MYIKISTKKRKHTSRGFTIFEMLVTLSVFALLTGVVLANYRAFDRAILLESLAHEVAMEIRKAQVSSTSVQEIQSAGSLRFTSSRGVYFNETSLVNRKKFIFFSDHVTVNRIYTSGACGGGGECLYEVNFPEQVEILDIQALDAGLAYPLDDVHISFRRPNPEAFIFGNKTAGGCVSSDSSTGCPTIVNRARILLATPAGELRQVEVWVTGHISVQ